MSTDFDQLTIKIKADSTQVTKAEETIIMDKLYDFFASKQLYLTDLFTKRLTDWTASCIKADVCPDVYAEWMHSKDDADHFRDVANDRDAHIKELTETIKKRNTEIGEFKLTIGERDASIERDAKTMQDLQDMVTDLSEGVISYQEDAEEHANEINKLKARMYDIMSSHTTREELIREWGTGGF